MFFTYGYDCCRFFYRPIQFFHNLKYAWQRAIRGYCDRDIWNLDIFYSDLFYQTLNKLADDTNDYPGIEPWETPEKWEEYLREMASLFKSCEKDEAFDMMKKAFFGLWW